MPESNVDNNIIQVDGLSKFFGKLKAVDGISFNVKRGEIFAFLGPNGAGKTTTIKMLTTLLRPSNGMVFLNGFDALKQSDKVRQSFGIVFQDQSLDDELTVLENMEFHGVLYNVPTVLRKQRIQELLMFVELWDRRNDLVKTFSGGMKRRLEIARGLLHRPLVLFLDEPTIGLDPQTRNHIWSYLKELNERENTTIFFTTHYMEEVERIASRIAVMDFGKIVAQGTSTDLINQTNSKSLEEAFISLTGHNIRESEANAFDNMRMRHRLWRK